MYIYLSKILPLLVLPIGIAFELLLIALILLWRRKNKSSAVFILAALVLLWVSSMPIVADSLLGALEQRYPAVALEKIPSKQCIVILGGAVEPALPPRVDVELLNSADRVYKASTLYHAGKGRLIIVAGGIQPWSSPGQTEAEAIRILLMEWGVPRSNIVLEVQSRNTRENAVHTAKLLAENDCGMPLLVTSASHMTRSVAAFVKMGVRVFPVSTDIRVVQTEPMTVFDFLPQADGLYRTSAAIREWIGIKVYQIRGWN